MSDDPNIKVETDPTFEGAVKITQQNEMCEIMRLYISTQDRLEKIKARTIANRQRIKRITLDTEVA